MGNCIALQDKLIQVVKTDGKILEYKAPLKVHQLLSDYTAGHAISQTFPVIKHLREDADMHAGQLYYLVAPLQELDNNGVVRIKVVIRKQELEEMLSKGVSSVEDMISQLQNKQLINTFEKSDSDCDNNISKGWKPVLQSIPEAC